MKPPVRCWCPIDSPIERANSVDLMELATGVRPETGHIGAILMLDRPLALSAVRAGLAARVASIPRLRQRLVRTPLGCGPPIWVDHARFDIARQVRETCCPTPGDERALLDLAADLVTSPLPMSGPLWSATLVSGLEAGRAALVVVLHHVLADGIGGLAILANLIDGAPAGSDPGFPRPVPSRRRLAVDALCRRLHQLTGLPAGLGRLRGGIAELRRADTPTAPRCSLNRPTGPRRRIAVARGDLAALRATAHRHGGTINDVALTAVTGALRAVLRARGETVDAVVISIPVSARDTATATRLGNHIAIMPVELPITGETIRRLDDVASTMARRKAAPRAAWAAVIAPVSRAVAQLGLMRWFADRQHLFSTVVTNLRGPSAPVAFLGATVTDLIPLPLTMGNVTASFAVFSYAGTFSITIVADPDTCPDLPALADAVHGEIDALARPVGAHDG